VPWPVICLVAGAVEYEYACLDMLEMFVDVGQLCLLLYRIQSVREVKSSRSIDGCCTVGRETCLTVGLDSRRLNWGFLLKYICECGTTHPPPQAYGLYHSHVLIIPARSSSATNGDGDPGKVMDRQEQGEQQGWHLGMGRCGSPGRLRPLRSVSVLML
jgi:hypothetical protein